MPNLESKMTDPTTRPAGLRLMAVHAHPDDESSKGAATTARYAAEGVSVLVVSCTGGERGSVLNPKFEPKDLTMEQIAQVRRGEMDRAAQALGVQHQWLGFEDSGLPEGDPLPPLPEGSFATLNIEVAAQPLVAAVRQFRPHVITTYDPSGGYPHPDHIMTNRVAVEAFNSAGDPTRYPNAGEIWQPLKLYYNHDFSLSRTRTLHEAMLAAGLESPYGEWITTRQAREIPERPVTTRIHCAEYYGQRDAALLAHATQIDPDGFFFAVPREIEAKVWGVEEYELAYSHVPVPELPDLEDDLFAGITADLV